jgi:pimeloyl-ACP methyl ester carboxylesterase
MPAQTWFDLGYIKQLEPHFHVITIEPRGHGASLAPLSSSEYTLTAMSSDIHTLVLQLKLNKVICWGYSLGAKLALGFAQSYPDSVSGLVLGGFEPQARVHLADDLVYNTLKQGGKAWMELWKKMFAVPDTLANYLMNANTQALLALRQAEIDWPSLMESSAPITVPSILYAGEHCFFHAETQAVSRNFTNARYFERHGKNHFDLMLEPEWICHEVISHFTLSDTP